MVGDVREELAGSLVPGKNQILKESFNLLKNRLKFRATCMPSDRAPRR